MIVDEVKKVLSTLNLEGVETQDVVLETPADRRMGDVALPCFPLAKILKKSPVQIARDIVEKLWDAVENNDAIDRVVATGPYVNFFMNTGWLAKNILWSIEQKQSSYGSGDKKDIAVLVEWRSPNTHKMLHVGHLRNALVSETMCSLLEFAWYKVFRTAYGGDIWAHVAKWLRYYDNFVDEPYPEDPQAFSIWSGDIYQQATAKIDENPEVYKQQIHEIQRLLETWDSHLRALREETRALSIAWMQSVFDELWCKIERFYRESEVEQPWIELVKKYEQDPNIPEIKTSQGAIIADLEAYDLGIFLLLKSNGTSLYSTKDIALAFLKEKEYDFDISLYVVATEQNLHFKQLFKTLELVGYDASKLVHMGYELVELPDGKMSSRRWTIIPYHVWREDALQQAMELIADRDVKDKEQLAHDVAFAALKFSFLLQDTYKKIRIDMKKSLSFQGETGPYLQYTFARCMSVLRKHEDDAVSIEHIDGSLLNQEEERILLVMLSEFESVIDKASREYKPHLLARYVLDLAKTFNNYYQKYKIITDDEASSNARLALVKGVKQVLENGLRLLGIERPEKM